MNHLDALRTAPYAPVTDQAVQSSKSAISWAAILAGAAAAISVSIVLLTLGSGLGLASLTPSTGTVASAGGLAVLATVWILVVQWLSAAAGGYVTGRLRTRWIGTHTHEVFFRDTAHGFLAWAVATAIVVLVVASAASSLLAGGVHAATTMASDTAQGAGRNSPAGRVTPYDVDTLFRGTSGDANSRSNASVPTDDRGEATRILANGLSSGGVPDADRTYLANLVSAQTGISQADAQKRVDAVVARSEEEAEAARKAAAATSLTTALAMVIGAFVACAAAALGGHERDRHP